MAGVQLWQFRICVTSFWEFYSENRQALKSRLTWSVLLQLSTKPEQPGWLRDWKVFHMESGSRFSTHPSQNVQTPLLCFTSLVLLSCLNAWISNQLQFSVCPLRLFRVCWLFSTTSGTETTTWHCSTTASMMESGTRWSWIGTAESSPCG